MIINEQNFSNVPIFCFVQVESFVKIFPNASHGWALRYDPTNPKALNEAEAAHKIMIDWFDKHLKK